MIFLTYGWIHVHIIDAWLRVRHGVMDTSRNVSYWVYSNNVAKIADLPGLASGFWKGRGA